MNYGLENVWGSLFLLVLTFFNWSCSNSITEVELGETLLDSMLIEAVNSTKNQEFSQAFHKLQNVVELARKDKDVKNEILGNINLGNLYLVYNNHEEALNYFFISRDLAIKNSVDELLNTIYNNIGIIYSSNGEGEQAETYFSKALELSKKRNEPKRIAINLINLGSAKQQAPNTDEAFECYGEALLIVERLKDTANMAAVINNIGNLFFEKGNFLEAKKYYQNAIDLGLKRQDNYFLPMFQLNYGKTFSKLNENDSALVYLKSALSTFLVYENSEKIIESSDWLAQTYQFMGVADEAISYYSMASMYKDSLLLQKRSKWVSEMHMNFELGQKKKEIEFIQHKRRQEKHILWTSILALMVISALIAYSLKVKNENLKHENVILANEQELTNLEIAKNQLYQEKLIQQLEMKNRELASKAIHLVNKNDLLSSLTGLLDQINVTGQGENRGILNSAKRTIAQNINLDEQWADFKKHFEEVHVDFFNQLVDDYPSLSQTDLRLSAYLMINLNAKEIAQISNISPASVRKRKQRLREKLNICKDEPIQRFLSKYALEK